MDENNTGLTLESVIDRPDPPPLRIHHIMAATAVTALLFSIHSMVRQGNLFGMATFLESGNGIVYTIATAVATTLVLLGFWWRHQGRVFFDMPGHWLLLDQSLAAGIFLLAAVGAVARTTGVTASDRALGGLVAVWFLAINAMMLGLNVWAAFKVADSRAWRALLLFQGVRTLLIFVLGSVGIDGIEVFNMIPLISLILLTVAAVGDLKSHRPRDWPHWIGVFLSFGISFVFLAQQGWNWFSANF